MGGMAMLNYDAFEAFKWAGVPDEKARRAAEALIGAVFAMNEAILVRLLVSV